MLLCSTVTAATAFSTSSLYTDIDLDIMDLNNMNLNVMDLDNMNLNVMDLDMDLNVMDLDIMDLMEIIDINDRPKSSNVSFFRRKAIMCVVASNNMKWPKNTVKDMADAEAAREKAFDDLNRAMQARAEANMKNRMFVPAYTVEDVFG